MKLIFHVTNGFLVEPKRFHRRLNSNLSALSWCESEAFTLFSTFVAAKKTESDSEVSKSESDSNSDGCRTCGEEDDEASQHCWDKDKTSSLEEQQQIQKSLALSLSQQC
ncbi:unnamed protein product [Microthlaspi erraticum]|uniref:Uncharacterized protein n=1 Tax=Microthlaspi erraticum TaxID=1685480 RepID=A0A6D2I5W4_9BRAS|nr:unnamed protein product [Microthlaspi erraticum]